MKKLPLRTKIVLVFCLVVLVIIVGFFLVNRIFWGRIAIRMDRSMLRETYGKLSELIKNPDTEVADLENEFKSAKSKQNMNCVLQGTGDWEFTVISQKMVSEFERTFLKERLQANFIMGSKEGVTVYEKTDNYTIQRVDLSEDHSYMECFGYMADAYGSQKKFILSIPLQNLFEMSGISERFFVFMGLFILVIGAVTIFLVTLKLTKPVLKLTEISKKLTNLDFSEKYDGKSTDEIGVLGENMNQMAERLESTISELRETNEKLREANEKLQEDIDAKTEVDNMRKEFIANVSHELKTPIALVQGYAEGLKEFRDNPESFDYYCDVITDEADKMNRMVKKLTTLNQLEFGASDYTETDFDIVDLIRGFLSGAKKITEDHQAKIILNLPEEAMVSADEFKIEEVFNNYFSNALNHLKEPNEIQVTVSEKEEKYRIEVFNTGENIPEAELQNIWEKFYKVDKARTRSYGGSGIGLSIVKAIMEVHGENYGVENKETGVLFFFELKKAAETGEQK